MFSIGIVATCLPSATRHTRTSLVVPQTRYSSFAVSVVPYTRPSASISSGGGYASQTLSVSTVYLVSTHHSSSSWSLATSNQGSRWRRCGSCINTLSLPQIRHSSCVRCLFFISVFIGMTVSLSSTQKLPTARSLIDDQALANIAHSRELAPTYLLPCLIIVSVEIHSCSGETDFLGSDRKCIWSRHRLRDIAWVDKRPARLSRVQQPSGDSRRVCARFKP